MDTLYTNVSARTHTLQLCSVERKLVVISDISIIPLHPCSCMSHLAVLTPNTDDNVTDTVPDTDHNVPDTDSDAPDTDDDVPDTDDDVPNTDNDGPDTNDDVDECTVMSRPCDANAVCTNIDGSYECTCKWIY